MWRTGFQNGISCLTAAVNLRQIPSSVTTLASTLAGRIRPINSHWRVSWEFDKWFPLPSLPNRLFFICKRLKCSLQVEWTVKSFCKFVSQQQLSGNRFWISPALVVVVSNKMEKSFQKWAINVTCWEHKKKPSMVLEQRLLLKKHHTF